MELHSMKGKARGAFMAAAIVAVVVTTGCTSSTQINSYLLVENSQSEMGQLNYLSEGTPVERISLLAKLPENSQSRMEQLSNLPRGTPVERILSLVKTPEMEDPMKAIRTSNSYGVVKNVRLGNVQMTGTPAELEADSKKWEGVEAWFIYAKKVDSEWSVSWDFRYSTEESGIEVALVFLVKDGKTISDPYFDIKPVNGKDSAAILPDMLKGIIRTAPGVGIGMTF